MADLLNDNDITSIENAFGDIYDTFFKYLTTIKKRVRKKDLYKNERGGLYETTDIEVRCLDVVDKGGTDAENLIQQQGARDFSEGYFLFAVRDLEAVGLFANNVCSIIAGNDSIVLNSVNYNLIGVNQLLGFDGKYELVKVHFEKALK